MGFNFKSLTILSLSETLFVSPVSSRHAVTVFKVQDVAHHFFPIKLKLTAIDKSPAFELSVGANIVGFGGDFDATVSQCGKGVEKHFIDVA